MKKSMLTISVILVICIIMVYVFCSLPFLKDYVSIQDDNIYFGMSKNTLLRIKGQPFETAIQRGDTPMDEYVFQEILDGYAVCCTYVFYRNRLLEVECIVEDISYEDALALSNRIEKRQKEQYVGKVGYYYEPFITNGSTSFNISHGTNTGPGGILFDINYVSGQLRINAVKQD